ncbi:MAG TPA: hypothetical protein VF815_23675 [Myxococcaceae bacterium]|jgi:tetratricopeptide (TPR) repeat protein
MVLVLALLRPTPAFSKGEDEMRGYLLSIHRLYQDLEYERALAQIERAKAVARTTDENVALSLYEGVVLADMSRWAESSAAFKEALFLRPDAKLPVKVAPKVAQHFEKVRESVKKELQGGSKPPEVSAQTPAPKPAPPAAAPKPAAPVIPEVRPEPKPEQKAEAKPEPKPVAKAEVKPEAPKPAPKAEVKPEAPRPVPLPPEAVPVAPTMATGRSFLRPRVLIPAIAGGVLLAAGGTSWAMSRKELSRLNNDDQSLDTREEVRSVASRGSTLQTLGVGMLGAGVVSLGIAAGMYASSTPSSDGALMMGTDGTSAFVMGRWP